MKGLKTETKLFIAAVLSGVAAVFLAYMLISGKKEALEKSMEPVKVVSASKYIPSWTKLGSENLKYTEIPARFVTRAHVTDIKDIEERFSMVPFIQGEPVLANKLSDRGEQLNIAIPTGLRAVSIGVDEESGVGYMIRPGDHVDVMLTYTDTGAKTKALVTAMLLQDARVVAVGTDFSYTKKSMSYSSVTLALTPEEAELITFARAKGRLSLALRPLGDRGREKIKMVSFDDLTRQIRKNEKGEEAPGRAGAGRGSPADVSDDEEYKIKERVVEE
ncbi:MAG TPA: Flp pilus assembly protein CpaB [bacterium]|nr:Flp pilus assembly protein CpaB [bacterium]